MDEGTGHEYRRHARTKARSLDDSISSSERPSKSKYPDLASQNTVTRKKMYISVLELSGTDASSRASSEVCALGDARPTDGESSSRHREGPLLNLETPLPLPSAPFPSFHAAWKISKRARPSVSSSWRMFVRRELSHPSSGTVATTRESGSLIFVGHVRVSWNVGANPQSNNNG